MTVRNNRRQFRQPDASDAVASAFADPDGTPVTQVVFIESNVPDAKLLADGVKPGVRAVLLDPADDGIQQIAAYLANNDISGLSRISIVSHGADGEMQLGSGMLAAATIGQYHSALASIGAALQPDGALQLYGCDIGQDADGVAFLNQLSVAVGGASVDAASHVVGSSNDGGSWNLDVDLGSTAASSPFTEKALASYQGALGTAGTGELLFASLSGVETSAVSGGTLGTPSNLSSLSSGDTLPVGLTVDAPLGRYFVAESDFATFDQIDSGSLSGGTVTTVFNVPVPDQQTVSDLAINQATGTLYYSAMFDGSSVAQGGVYSVDIGNAATLVTSAPTLVLSEYYVNSMALDVTNNLLFAAEGDPGASNDLWVVDLNNGVSADLTSELSASIRSSLSSVSNTTLLGVAVDAASSTVYFSTADLPDIENSGTNPSGVGTDIFSAEYNLSGTTVSVGSSTALYSGAAAGVPVYLKIDPQDSVLYETSDLDSNIYSLNLSGSGALTTVAAPGGQPAALTYVSTPVVSASGTVEVAAENTPLLLDPIATVSNSDGTDLAGATVAVVGGTFAGDGDTLAATTAGTNINASYSAATESLTLSGIDTAAHYEAVMDSVTIRSTAVSKATRTIDWSATDGFLTSAVATSSVTINNALCFCHGTLIGTPGGEVQVEKLTVGDLVLTVSNGPRAVTWIGKGKVLATRGLRSAATPVIVQKGALAENVPHQDLRVTKSHSLYLGDALIPVEYLVNHKTIIWDDRAGEVEVYHIELATHDLLLANGTPAESYRDDGNRWLFQNANSGWELPSQQPCAPVLTGGPIVDAVWRRLLDRAGARDLPPMTDDPDLHLIVDGQRLEIAERRAEFYIFRLVRCPNSVHVASRHSVPMELGLARDPRSLGVALQHIAIRSGTKFEVIKADDSRLVDGFHDYEAGDNLRWTNGYAALPPGVFARFPEGAEILLRLAGATQYLDEGEQTAFDSRCKIPATVRLAAS